MPHFDFDAARRERQAARDPITFTLGGQDFTCLPAIPFEMFAQVVENDATVTAVESFRYDCRFVADCLPDGEQARWQQVLTDKAEPVEEDDVAAVVRQLVVAYATRPTSPSPASSDGRRSTGGPSKSTATGRSRAKKRAA